MGGTAGNANKLLRVLRFQIITKKTRDGRVTAAGPQKNSMYEALLTELTPGLPGAVF